MTHLRLIRRVAVISLIVIGFIWLTSLGWFVLWLASTLAPLVGGQP